jgi:nonribosomal peptide synthetase protein VioO
MREALSSGVPAGIAYVLFTSGSTGEPKPVLTPRTAIGTVVASLRELFALTPDDRVLQFASLNWDTCFEEILPTLTAGAALVFDAEAHTGSFPRFLRMIEQRGVTVLDLPTAFWHELVRHLAEEGHGLPAGVRLVVIGGEAANPARVAEWLALAPEVQLLNTYGCTETTLITHAAAIDDAGVPPIGRALPHVRELVTDDGELLIGGPALAAGYLGRPEATDERFVLRAGERWFRTGDRVRRRADGLLLHEGRLDHVVKIRGVRVDPGEVEAQLTRHPAVDAAAVVGTALAGRTALVAYVVARDENDDLLGWLRARVPAHLVPSRLTYVPALERTASGKADRAATHRRHAPRPLRKAEN